MMIVEMRDYYWLILKAETSIVHLLQKNKDNEYWSYQASVAYLRKNAILLDYNIQSKASNRLMHVENDQIEGKSLEEVSRLFTTMAEEEGLETTFRMFNTKIFRDKLSIPTSIWNELEPSIREKNK